MRIGPLSFFPNGRLRVAVNLAAAAVRMGGLDKGQMEEVVFSGMGVRAWWGCAGKQKCGDAESGSHGSSRLCFRMARFMYASGGEVVVWLAR